MCKHHWMLGMTTIEGTPACCKLCGAERTFYAKGITWEASSEARRRPYEPQPARITRSELPFNPHGYIGKLAGNRL